MSVEESVGMLVEKSGLERGAADECLILVLDTIGKKPGGISDASEEHGKKLDVDLFLTQILFRISTEQDIQAAERFIRIKNQLKHSDMGSKILQFLYAYKGQMVLDRLAVPSGITSLSLNPPDVAPIASDQKLLDFFSNLDSKSTQPSADSLPISARSTESDEGFVEPSPASPQPVTSNWLPSLELFSLPPIPSTIYTGDSARSARSHGTYTTDSGNFDPNLNNLVPSSSASSISNDFDRRNLALKIPKSTRSTPRESKNIPVPWHKLGKHNHKLRQVSRGTFRFSESGNEVFDKYNKEQHQRISKKSMGYGRNESKDVGKILHRQPLVTVAMTEYRTQTATLMIGIQSWLFPFENESEFQLRANCTASGISREACLNAMAPFLTAGKRYRELRNFITPAESVSKVSLSPQKDAYVTGLARILAEYSKEVDEISRGTHHFSTFLLLLEPYCSVIKTLRETTEKVLVGNSSPLSLLYKIVSQVPSEYPIRGICLQLLEYSLEPFLKCLELWLEEGNVWSYMDDFFIVEVPLLADVRGRDFWKRAFVLRTSSIPSFMDKELAEKILVLGKTARFLRLCPDIILPPTQDYSDQSESENCNLDQSEETFSTLDWILNLKPDTPIVSKLGSETEAKLNPSIPVGFQLRHSIIGNLIKLNSKDHSKLACNYLWSVLAPHLDTTRRLLLCGDGGFIYTFSQSLFSLIVEGTEGGLKGNKILTPSSLNEILTSALDELRPHRTETDTLPSIKMGDVSASWDSTASFSQIFSWLEIDYQIPWPANLILTDSLMSQYNCVFRLLLSLQWVQFCLKDILEWLSTNTPDIKLTGDLHRLHLCRHEMQHFLHYVQSYLANQVIEASWSEFETHLEELGKREEGLTIDNLYSAHKHYVAEILTRCALNSKAERLKRTLEDVMDLILKFKSTLHSCDPLIGQVEDAYTVYSVFQHRSKFFFQVLKILSTRGYEEGRFDDLLLRLNFNRFYDS